MQIYHSLTVDVAKRNQYKAVSAKQLDCNSRFLKIELQNNGSAFDIPNNATIAMAVERNGETKAFNCTYEDNYIVAPLDTWILQESGYVDCEIILLDTETNSKLSSFLFSLEIEQNIYNDEDIKSDKNYDLLLSLIGDVKSSQIVSITEKVNGLKHTYTVLFGSGESKEFVLSDGAKGDKGDPGTAGKDGAPGKDGIRGKDGYTPIKGVDYFDGDKGEKGEKGDRGEQGVKGDRGEKGEQGIQGLPGTTVYSELSDKPIINGVTLEGDKSLSDLGVPTKISELTDDSDFVKKDEYASASQAGIIRTPVGCGISVDKDGSAHVDFPLREVTSKTDDIRVTHGSGVYTLEFNSGKYATWQDAYNKQDKLSAEQLNNINAVPNKIDKSEVGNGLKFADGKLQLDIPVATADTGYGG